MKEHDANADAASNPMLEEQKRTNELISALVDMQKAGAAGGGDSPLFPN